MGDIFYNKTVTVFNRFISDDVRQTETWYPTVLTGVRLLTTKGANVSTSGMESADSAKLFIKTDKLDRPYMKPLEWDKAEDKGSAFTVRTEDFFVEGDRSEEDTTEDDFFSVMKEKYDNCFKVTNVDTYELIPHLEVGGA